MKRCPITYDVIAASENYSQRGLHLLAPQLSDLLPLAYSSDEQRKQAVARAGKMSVQGVQMKLSAQLKIKQQCFELVDQFGHYILKPQSELYKDLPENEAVSMSLAAMIGIEVPVHGLMYAADGSLTYFIKRFDRVAHKQKVALEDFSQLLGASRDTKYDSTMEKVCSVILNPDMCSFPKIEALKFFKLTVFNYLIGNEDMHLKNFSLITRGKITSLAPAYDLLNSTIAVQGNEELALSLAGKKKNLKQQDLIGYLGYERLGLNEKVVDMTLQSIKEKIPAWIELLEISFLSNEMKAKYIELLKTRVKKLL